MARRGRHPGQICRVKSGWVILANMQYLKGYCILLADPLVNSLNELDVVSRQNFLTDMATVGDAIQVVTGAYRINYAIMGNSDPYLHAHIVPRYLDEPEDMLHNHPWAYSDEVMQGRMLDEARDEILARKLAETIKRLGGSILT